MNLPANGEHARNAGSIPGSGRYPGEGNVHPLHYSCLGNPTDRGAWWAHKSVTKRITNMTEHSCVLRHVLFFFDPMDCSLTVFSLHGISQARILEWGAISFSRGSSQSRDQTHVSYIGKRILYTELPPYHRATPLLGIYPRRKKTLICKDISSVQLLSRVQLFATPWTACCPIYHQLS